MHASKTSLTPEIKECYNSIHLVSSSTSPIRSSLGHEKLKLFHNNKQLAEEIKSVSNKIQLILKCETKAKEQQAKNKKKAEEDLQKKARNESKLKDKEYLSEYRKREVENLRKQNLIEKEERRIAIKALQNSIIRERHQLANEVKKSRAELDEIGRGYKEMIRKKNYAMKSNRIKEVVNRKQNSRTLEYKFNEDLKQAYQDKILYEKRLYQELMIKMKEIEKQEVLAIENYSKTLKNTGMAGVEFPTPDEITKQ